MVAEREEWDGQVTGQPFEERPYGRVRLSEGLLRRLRSILIEEMGRTSPTDDENSAQRRKRERRHQQAADILHNVEGTLAEKGW